MKRGLFIIERLILESISKGNNHLEALLQDTKQDIRVVSNTLDFFEEHLVLDKKGAFYYVNDDMMKDWLKTINSSWAVCSEVQELLGTLVKDYFSKKGQDSSLKMQKVHMTKSEEKIFKNHIEGLEKFIKDVNINRKFDSISCKTSEQKVVFWGSSNYGNLVDCSLHGI